jgi:hypothetical protein
MEKEELQKIKKMLDRAAKNACKVEADHAALLDHVGANTLPNAKRKIDRERAEFSKTKEQLTEVVGALEVDNWRNAVVRARSLLNKLERESLPVWLKSISPYWVGVVNPNQYKYWLNFCREQYLMALTELQKDVELGLEVNFEDEIDAMGQVYLTSKPAEFIERVSEYITSNYDNEGDLI